jgi:hypothetical protein
MVSGAAVGDFEAYTGDVAGVVLTHQLLGVAFHLVFCKNEAMIGGLPGKPFMFMEFEERGGVFQVATLAFPAFGLDLAQLFERFLELTRQAMPMDAQVAEEAMGVDDVEIDGGLVIGRISGAGQQVGLEERDAVDAPGGVGQFADELGFGGSGGLVFVAKLAVMSFERGVVFGGEDGGEGG